MRSYKLGDEIAVSVSYPRAKKYILKIIPAVFLLALFGCATTGPGPVTIKHERTPSLSDAASSDQQYYQQPEDQAVAAPPVEIVHEGKPSQSDAAESNQQRQKEPADQSMVALLDLLKSKNIISSEEAAHLLSQALAGSPEGKGTVTASEKSDREQIVKTARDETKIIVRGPSERASKQIAEKTPTETKSDTTQVVKTATGDTKEVKEGLPEWIRRITLSGDIRLRYEHDDFDQNNAQFAQPSNPSQLMNTTADQNLYRYRVRLQVSAQVVDPLGVVVRLSTGNSGNPVSINALWGNFFEKDNVVLDLAYVKWQPSKSLALYGGRMPNPFFNATDLLWANDLSFVGVAMNVHMWDPAPEEWIPFLNAGWFPLQVNSFATQTKWLAAGQLGVEKQSKKGIAAKLGVGYNYFNQYMTGIRNDPSNPGATDWTAPLFQQKGNTLFNISADPNVIKTAYASAFHELNINGSLDIGLWDPYHIILLGEFVKNLGFNQTDIYNRTGSIVNKSTVGYQIGLSVGYPTTDNFSQWRGNPAIDRLGQWRAYFNYKYLQSDAVVDAFTDSDFHLGGTNAKGWILGGDLALSKNIWLRLRWLTANEITGPPLSIDVLQFDFNARF